MRFRRRKLREIEHQRRRRIVPQRRIFRFFVEQYYGVETYYIALLRI